MNRAILYSAYMALLVGIVVNAGISDVVDQIYGELLEDYEEDGEVQQDDVKSAKETLQALYAYASLQNMSDLQDKIRETYTKEHIDGDVSELQQAAQQAAPAAQPQAPAGIQGTNFEQIVNNLGGQGQRGIQDDAVEALKFLFGEASPNAKIYQEAGITNPEEADNKAPGAQLDKALTNYKIEVNATKQ